MVEQICLKLKEIFPTSHFIYLDPEKQEGVLPGFAPELKQM